MMNFTSRTGIKVLVVVVGVGAAGHRRRAAPGGIAIASEVTEGG